MVSWPDKNLRDSTYAFYNFSFTQRVTVDNLKFSLKIILLLVVTMIHTIADTWKDNRQTEILYDDILKKVLYLPTDWLVVKMPSSSNSICLWHFHTSIAEPILETNGIVFEVPRQDISYFLSRKNAKYPRDSNKWILRRQSRGQQSVS